MTSIFPRVESSPPKKKRNSLKPTFYAMTTYAATSEGQIGIVQDEPLEVLDDKDSYWWLVRPVNSPLIGYVPAEYVETPNERTARLNRDKNVQDKLNKMEMEMKTVEKKSPFPSPKRVQIPSDVQIEFIEYISSSDTDDEYDEAEESNSSKPLNLSVQSEKNYPQSNILNANTLSNAEDEISFCKKKMESQKKKEKKKPAKETKPPRVSSLRYSQIVSLPNSKKKLGSPSIETISPENSPIFSASSQLNEIEKNMDFSMASGVMSITPPTSPLRKPASATVMDTLVKDSFYPEPPIRQKKAVSRNLPLFSRRRASLSHLNVENKLAISVPHQSKLPPKNLRTPPFQTSTVRASNSVLMTRSLSRSVKYRPVTLYQGKVKDLRSRRHSTTSSLFSKHESTSFSTASSSTSNGFLPLQVHPGQNVSTLNKTPKLLIVSTTMSTSQVIKQALLKYHMYSPDPKELEDWVNTWCFTLTTKTGVSCRLSNTALLLDQLQHFCTTKLRKTRRFTSLQSRKQKLKPVSIQELLACQSEFRIMLNKATSDYGLAKVYFREPYFFTTLKVFKDTTVNDLVQMAKQKWELNVNQEFKLLHFPSEVVLKPTQVIQGGKAGQELPGYLLQPVQSTVKEYQNPMRVLKDASNQKFRAENSSVEDDYDVL
ncbi:hypothetical protein HMI54_014744 [Coelomomyces lativittatus]|nr:hypothetical protein HMI54_014744 [Coelomomyces lativittatus]